MQTKPRMQCEIRGNSHSLFFFIGRSVAGSQDFGEIVCVASRRLGLSRA